MGEDAGEPRPAFKAGSDFQQQGGSRRDARAVPVAVDLDEHGDGHALPCAEGGNSFCRGGIVQDDLQAAARVDERLAPGQLGRGDAHGIGKVGHAVRKEHLGFAQGGHRGRPLRGGHLAQGHLQAFPRLEVRAQGNAQAGSLALHPLAVALEDLRVQDGRWGGYVVQRHAALLAFGWACRQARILGKHGRTRRRCPYPGICAAGGADPVPLACRRCRLPWPTRKARHGRAFVVSLMARPYLTASGRMTSSPPMYGRSTAGMTMEPSSCW